jgi:hypothetical protein
MAHVAIAMRVGVGDGWPFGGTGPLGATVGSLTFRGGGGGGCGGRLRCCKCVT